MSTVDPLVELLILGAIVAAIGYFYYNLLGSRSADDPTIDENVVPIHPVHTSKGKTVEPQLEDINVSGDGIYVLEDHMPGFKSRDFLSGAEAAFRMIVEAFAKGDTKTLSTLLGPELLKSFGDSIKEREKAGHTLEAKVVHVNKAQVVQAEIKKGFAQVKVRYATSQLNKLTDKKGKVLEETPQDSYDSVADLWTYQKSLRDTSPHWILIQTEPVEE